MSRKKIVLLLGMLVTLMSVTTLSRCGSGVGLVYDSQLNKVKF